MACLRYFQCGNCGKKVHDVQVGSYPYWCSKCRNSEADKKKRTHLKGLEALTVEARLSLREKWQYEHDHGEHGKAKPPARF